MNLKQATLEWVVGYQLQLAERYGYFISLVLNISLEQSVDGNRLVQSGIRNCDAFFTLDNYNAIIMSHTSAAEADHVIERLRRSYEGEFDFRYAVATFPADARNARDLIARAERRLTTAKTIGFGAVVTSGNVCRV